MNLLDFIAHYESSGNYNAYYGHAGSQDDLSKYTLDQVLSLQQTRVSQGAKSSAIGRYQFIRKTLGSLKVSMKLLGNERFTPELQDRLATELLKGRGLQKFLSGKITAEEFGLEISKEWASMPNPRTGRSFYAGDGLNKSLVPVQSFLEAIQKTKDEGEGQEATPTAKNPIKPTSEAPIESSGTSKVAPAGIMVLLVAIVAALIKYFG